MARKRVWIGSLGPFIFDSSKAFVSGARHALRTDLAPGSSGEVARYDEYGSGAGISHTVTFIVGLRYYGSVLQYQTQDVTFTDGIAVGLSAISAWTSV